MTTNDSVSADNVGQNVAKLEANLARVEELTQRLLTVIGQGRHVAPSLQGPSQELYMKAATAYMTEMMHNPAKLIEHQLELVSLLLSQSMLSTLSPCLLEYSHKRSLHRERV